MKRRTPTILRVLATLLMVQVSYGCSSSSSTRSTGVNPYLTYESLPRVCDPSLAPAKWAVVVGIDQYEDKRIAPLSGAVSDAWTFYHYIASPQGGAVPADHAQLLLNGEATREAIEGALGNFLAKACPQDQVLVYFAGHGTPEPGRPEEAFLLPHDANLSNLIGSGVAMSRLPGFLAWRAGNVGSLVLFVDACHSGHIKFDGFRGFKDPGTIDLERIDSVQGGVSRMVENTHRWAALSASGAGQLAGETKNSCKIGDINYSGGLFTCRLLEGLAGGADADGDAYVTLGELYQHVHDKVAERTQNAQEPRLSGSLPRDTPLATVPAQPVAIPPIPGVYTHMPDDTSNVMSPLVWTGAGLSIAALAAGLYFSSRADEVARGTRQDLADGVAPISEYDAALQDHQRYTDLSTVSYSLSALLGTVALSIGVYQWLGVEEQSDREDAYSVPPWFEVQLDSRPGSQSIQATFRY